MLPETFELFVSLRWVLGAALTPPPRLGCPAGMQPLVRFPSTSTVGHCGHREVGEIPGSPGFCHRSRSVAHTVSPRDSPQLDEVVLLVTAPLCPVPSSSMSWGCPGLPGSVAAPGGELGLRNVGYGDLQSGDVGFGDQNMRDMGYGDLWSGDGVFGDQGLRDTSYGDLHPGDVDLRDLGFSDLHSGDLG